MHIIGLIIFIAVVNTLYVKFRKDNDRTLGDGMGIKNNEKWGIDEGKKSS